MTRVACFTSFTFSYLNRARVLFESLRKFHPDWRLIALVTDRPPPEFTFRAVEPWDELVFGADVAPGIEPSWLFKHDVVEVCTAVKGPFLKQLCEDGRFDVAMYLDPDTCLFNNLNPLLEALEVDDILLTPHLLEPEEDDAAVQDNEISALRAGIYNLGFVAIKTAGAGRQFADWWASRLTSYCYDDIPLGLFVDQRWCDHVPALFDRVRILRDPGYNVASWNLSRRKVSIAADGVIYVNGHPLRFWHFTKLGPVGDAMTKRYAGSNYEVYEIWSQYREKIAAATDASIPNGWWEYGQFSDGTKIEKSHRVLYRARADLQKKFPDPYDSGGLLRWIRKSPSVLGDQQ